MKAAIEISSRTILLLILFLVIGVIIIMLGVKFGSYGNETVTNLTDIAQGF